ncbi:hypothetical protein U6M47_12675 [Cutibacterium acnes]
MNVALAVPQAVAPLLGALLVAAAGGFRPLFLLAATCAAGGAVALGRVRGVR